MLRLSGFQPGLARIVLLLCAIANPINGQNGTSPSTIFNNFITDFGPILSLFGAQPSKQFMSLSRGWADNIIFAVGPIGVLIIISDAIRVSGILYWLSFIGRARESSKTVELELLSSTSKDVCEIWEGHAHDKYGKVVRQQDRKDIEVILYDDESEEVYNLEQAVEKELLVPKDGETYFASLPPNLGLNVGDELPSRLYTWLFALLALFLQAGVFVVEGVSTYRLGWAVEGSAHYGFPLTLSGTVLLCVGLSACSHVVESSTKKVEFIPHENRENLKLLWIQRGLIQQSMTDKNGLAIERNTAEHETLKPIWVSKRIDAPGVAPWTHVGVILSALGWLMQVEGLRWMHWITVVLQLVLTIVMIALRSFLRRGLSGIPRVTEIHDGHELDWLAMKIAKAASLNVSKIHAFETNKEESVYGSKTFQI